MKLFESTEFLIFFLSLIPFWITAVFIQIFIRHLYYKKVEKKIEDQLSTSEQLDFIQDHKSTLARIVEFYYRKSLFIYSSVYIYQDCLYVKSYSKLPFRNICKPFLIQLNDSLNDVKKFEYILTNISKNGEDLEIRFKKIYESKSFVITLKKIEEKLLPQFFKDHLVSK